MYEVLDTWGEIIQSFPTYKQAYNFKYMHGINNWTIVEK